MAGNPQNAGKFFNIQSNKPRGDYATRAPEAVAAQKIKDRIEKIRHETEDENSETIDEVWDEE